MKRCFQLAEMGLGSEGTNPIVGAVIVHKDRIIGEGFYEKFGGKHAEVNAIESVREADRSLLSQSTIYVSLEPCSIFAKTPPCSQRIVKEGISEVVISAVDPNPEINGNSIRFLREQGVKVTSGILEKEGLHLIRRFRIFNQKKRPYIILKYAMTSDGMLGVANQQVWFSNALTKRWVHKARSEEAAIMVGRKTAETDNPGLTTRLWPGNHPIRVVLDSALRLNSSLKIFDGTASTFVFCDENIDKNINFKNVKYFPVLEKNDDLSPVLNILYNENIKSLIVEGGASLLQSFINQNFWDEARLIINNKPIRHFSDSSDFIPAPVLKGSTLFQTQSIQCDEIKIYHNPKSKTLK